MSHAAGPDTEVEFRLKNIQTWDYQKSEFRIGSVHGRVDYEQKEVRPSPLHPRFTCLSTH